MVDVAFAGFNGLVLIVLLAVVLERFAFCTLQNHEIILALICIILVSVPAMAFKIAGLLLAGVLLFANQRKSLADRN